MPWIYTLKMVVSVFCMGFPGGAVVKNLPANAGDPGSILGSGTSPGGGHGHPLWYGESHGQRSLVGYSPGGGKRAGHDIATATTRTKSPTQRVFLWPDYLVHAMWTYIFVLSSTHVEVVLSFSGRETFALRFLL